MRTTATPPSHALRIRIKRAGDGSVAAFALHRADGSVTIQRNPHAFFLLHDLTHLAIESTLELRRAFYGLVSEGWNFEDFGAPSRRGTIPEEALRAELLAGYLDLERATGQLSSAPELNLRMAEYYAERDLRPLPPPLTDETLAHIRTLRGELAAHWRAIPPGQSLDVTFTPGLPLAALATAAHDVDRRSSGVGA